ALIVWPEDAEARRFGGGKSFGSRGSKSFNTPKKAPQRTATSNNTQGAKPQKQGGFGKGALLGGLGGLVAGGLIGSMLFGGGDDDGEGGGFGGLLDMLLIGLLGFFAYKFFKSRKRTANVQTAGAGMMQQVGLDQQEGPMGAPAGGMAGGGGYMAGIDDVSQGIMQIQQSNPQFDEGIFMQGAQMAFQEIQSCWSDWSVDRLRPLLTDRMWEMVQQQAQDLKNAGQRNIIEKIQFHNVQITEAWQEAGMDYLTVQFQLSMIDTITDINGNIQEGDPNVPEQIEEFWTFTHQTGSADPNWQLSAIQQPGEVAKGTA
ncbi:MAG: Tim44 domain-containing protein, partial [Magnetococcales bacterium]|nr:Tim44 domain-containing protein [Magnetococcales bacterium]